MARIQRKPLASINITPLVDVLLILLAVLILAMPMYAKRFPVSIPKTTSTSGAPTSNKAITISLSSDGTLYLNETVQSREDILKKIDSNTSVELAVHSTTQYTKVAEILAGINDKHPKELSLITK